jgi:hypothetical protein
MAQEVDKFNASCGVHPENCPAFGVRLNTSNTKYSGHRPAQAVLKPPQSRRFSNGAPVSDPACLKNQQLRAGSETSAPFSYNRLQKLLARCDGFSQNSSISSKVLGARR